MRYSVMSLLTWTLSLCVLCPGCSDEKQPPDKQAGSATRSADAATAEKPSQHASPERSAKAPQPQVDATPAKRAIPGRRSAVARGLEEARGRA